MNEVLLGYSIPDADPVNIPLRHMVVTGQTQEAGKTTALEAMILRSGVRAVCFVTKRGEGSFTGARRIDPYFREQADWQFVASILEASRGEKLKFERAWIIRASRGASTLAEVQANIRRELLKAKGLSADVYLTLDAYLDVVVPQIDRVKWANEVELGAGVNAMDLTDLAPEMQHLVIRSTIRWILEHEKDTVVVVPEAWKFIPQGRGTPVKLAAEEFIRQAAAQRNYLWLDSQDIAGVDKIILKSVPVWILGVQRESNEIKRTLDQIPAGIKKPKPEQIATLGLGQFFACWGLAVTKTYVQPEWMPAQSARLIAGGSSSIENESHAHRPIAKPKERPPMSTEKIQTSEERIAAAVVKAIAGMSPPAAPRPLPTPPPRPPTEPATIDPKPAWVDDEAIYQRILARLKTEAPSILRVLSIEPEIHVSVETTVIETNTKELRGMVALMIKNGYLDELRTASAVHKEAKRLYDYGGNSARAYEQLDSLTALGFVTKEEGGYLATAAAKKRIRS